jgi:hypothetical protein
VQETPWVRSVYLYLMTVVSIALVGIGAVGFVVGAVHTIAPDLGHRDTLDRVGIGLANIANEVVDLVGETSGDDAEEFCRDVTDTEDDFQDCVADEGGDGESVEAIQDGISELRSELQSQIRNNSIDHMIRGLLLIGAGVLLFKIHGRRTELFADGLIPKAEPPVAAPPTALSPEASAPTTPLPPPPSAPPAL